MSDFDHSQYCAFLEAEIARFAGVLDGADLATPIPSCGDEWTLADLAEHVGSIHRWVEHMVRTLAPERVGRAALGLDIPSPGPAMTAWVRAGAAPLVAALRAADPAAGMWAWGADQHVRFWARRMVHETTVHRADAEMARGLPSRIDTALAADGLDEFLQNLPHAASWAPAVAEIRGGGETILLAARDRPLAWCITLRPEGFTWERLTAPDAARGGATARVTATADDLYLLLWNRRTPADPGFDGTGAVDLLGDFLRRAEH